MPNDKSCAKVRKISEICVNLQTFFLKMFITNLILKKITNYAN